MTANVAAAEIRCPACQTPLLIPVTLAVTGRGNGTITAHTAEAWAHVDTCPGAPTDTPGATS